MADSNEAVNVVHEPDESRYAIYVDGDIAGFAEYRSQASGTTFVFTHTEIDDEFSGRGLAKTLAKEALTHARSNDVRIVPVCPFIVSWLKKHPDFEDAVDWPN